MAAEVESALPTPAQQRGDTPDSGGNTPIWSALVGDIEAPLPPSTDFVDEEEEDGWVLRCFTAATGCCAGGYGAVQVQWSNFGEYLRHRR
jgi:hypothetical protein